MKDAGAYYDIFGSVIRLAIKDFVSWEINKKENEAKLKELRKKNVRDSYSALNCDHRDYVSAKEFLFNPLWLEARIKEYGLPLSIDYLRKKALDMDVELR